MTTVAQFLNEERAVLGTGESPPGSNQNKISAWYGMIGPWCAMTVTYCLARAGFLGFRYAYCPSIVNDARRGINGMQWLDKYTTILAGDLLLWDWNGDGVADHISVAETASPSGNIYTIGGNENDRCQRAVRNRACLMGVVRLPLGASQPAPGPQPGPGKLDVDGDLGPKTVMALQRLLGVAADGDMGPITKMALQRKLGFTGNDVDGDIGPKTIHALEVRIGATIDAPGQEAWGPDVTRHLQEALNAGRF